MNDTQPFEHGEEGTHSACNKRIRNEGGKARCCYCVPHSHCEFSTPKPELSKCCGAEKESGHSVGIFVCSKCYLPFEPVKEENIAVEGTSGLHKEEEGKCEESCACKCHCSTPLMKCETIHIGDCKSCPPQDDSSEVKGERNRLLYQVRHDAFKECVEIIKELPEYKTADGVGVLIDLLTALSRAMNKAIQILASAL